MATKGDQYEDATNNIWEFALRGELAEVRRALRRGVDPDLQNKTGWTAAHAAASGGHVEVLQELAKAGADLEAADGKGRTIAHAAAQKGRLAVLKWMERQKLPLHTLDCNGKPPVDMAAGKEVREYIKKVAPPPDPDLQAKAFRGGAPKKGWDADRKWGDRRRHFSGAAKKKQLQDKRARRKGLGGDGDAETRKTKAKAKAAEDQRPQGSADEALVTAFGERVGPGDDRPVKHTILGREDGGDLAERRADAMRPFGARPPGLGAGQFPRWPSTAPSILSMPLRPAWSYEDGKQALEARERASFGAWLEGLAAEHGKGLNNFERNLEVWRELWRVLELSDVVLHIVDVRLVLLHFAAPVWDYCKARRVEMVLVLNKADLVPEEYLAEWLTFFRGAEYFAGLRVVPIAADENAGRDKSLGLRRWARGDDGERVFAALRGCRVPLRNRDRGAVEPPAASLPAADFLDGRVEALEAKGGPLTVGCVGEPNMGKSSVINRLMGASKVGVGPTPGKTKHLQTHLLSPTVQLCDCPGLIFPKVGVPFGLQVLSGNYPVAQTREPYSAIRYLWEAGGQPAVAAAYGLTDPARYRYEGQRDVWCPFSVAEALADKTHLTTRGGRPDVARAANIILRDALLGHPVCLAFRPPAAAEEAAAAAGAGPPPAPAGGGS